MIILREEGKSVDGLHARVRRGVAEIVQQQQQAGVNVINDGEQSKISSATYIKDRLTGFEGEPSGMPGGDALLRDHPDFAQRFLSQVDQTAFMRSRPMCSGPISIETTRQSRPLSAPGVGLNRGNHR